MAAGCWAKKKIETEADLEDNPNELLSVRVDGDPDEPDVVCTNLAPTEIAQKATESDTPVSDKTVSTWLDSFKIGYRKMTKTIGGGSSADREQQFDLIAGHLED